jgi:hypothetical protein
MNLWGCLERRRTLWKVLEIVHHAQVNINVNRTKQEKKRKSVLAGHGMVIGGHMSVKCDKNSINFLFLLLYYHKTCT